jgi:uncharacterized protein
MKEKSIMKTKSDYDKPFRTCIIDLYKNDVVRAMKDIEHHKNVSCFQHSLRVSYSSYKIAKRFKLDYVSVARGGFLHDFYLYDWHIKGSHKGLHGFNHSKIALHNAQSITKLNKREIDIINKHMWPLNPVFPKYRESWLVQFVDKVITLKEILHIG